jgi:tRNA (mo5U34)-methyltransferase
MTFHLHAPPTPHTGPRGEQIARLAPWFHNLHLPTGEQTAPNHPLGDFPRFKWAQIQAHLPDDMAGMSALDIGCNAGFYSIELARRGARVTAIDHDDRYLSQARWAAAEFGVADRIDYRTMTVYDLMHPRPDLPDSFDLVIFMGVLYHLRYPLLGLDLAVSRIRGEDPAAAAEGGLLVFQTLTTPDSEISAAPDDLAITDRERLLEPGWPRMSFVERKLASDPTNWWVPNASCCEAMLRASGVRLIAQPGHEIYICRRAAAAAPEPWRAELAGSIQP